MKFEAGITQIQTITVPLGTAGPLNP